jgi:predicted ArsR family transcriptional regulator
MNAGAADKWMTTLPVTLERDVFMRSLIRELVGTLQDVVGQEQAAGFVSVVGQRMGEQVNEQYKTALKVERLNRTQVARVLVDLKRRIQGTFYVIEESDEKIVLGNYNCPFADKVVGRPAMCMMTSNLFGVIAARNLGRAKVILEDTIARGASECRVVVYLTNSEEAQAADGLEYFES